MEPNSQGHQRHTPSERTPPKTAPQSLANKITRGETKVSTFECTLQDILNDAYIMQYASISGMGRSYMVVHYP